MKTKKDNNVNEQIESEFKRIKHNLDFYKVLVADDIPLNEHKEVMDSLQYINMSDAEIKAKISMLLQSNLATKASNKHKKSGLFSKIAKREKKLKPTSSNLTAI